MKRAVLAWAGTSTGVLLLAGACSSRPGPGGTGGTSSDMPDGSAGRIPGGGAAGTASVTGGSGGSGATVGMSGTSGGGADGGPPHLSVQRSKQAGTNGGYVIFEVLDDGIVHFELSSTGTGPDATAPLAVSPQVARTDYDGPTRFVADATSIETSTVHIAVDPATLCLALSERGSTATLTTLCPSQLGQAGGGISLTPQATHSVYGLGEDFLSVNQPNGDWLGKQRLPGDQFGNKMVPFDGANAGNAQFPILYAANSGTASYALFLDDAHAQKYFFDTTPWKVQTGTSPFRAYWFVAPALPALRSSYMDLTGRPPVPPKKAFGLWVSEYGYENWGELEGKFDSLRQNQFPVDGFVLDLQWFGGVTQTAASSMGGLSWDLTNFPDPAGKLASYRTQGIGVITIEESYVAAGRGEYGDLAGRGYLVRDGCATCDPTSLTAWWGIGGMIDWTSDAAGDYWHDLKRQPLIGVGVLGHWIDLGEPEEYSAADWVTGFAGAHAHGDYQNLYGFSWARSIARGYTRNSVAQRAFILSRTGTSGIQRFGAAMWSGDVASKLSTLSTHMNAQMQMSMSGMDYFGADIGGFRRDVRTPGEDLNTLYTQWFAAGLWTDVPVRPHTANLKDTSETAPDRIGDFASNLANLRQRYELVPYYYSLAHRAYRFGEPVVPPPAFYYQDDANVRGLGSEKMIGKDIIVALVANAAATTRDVYLPAGDWVNYQTNAWLHSTGQTFAAQPLTVGGVFRVPTYVRAGAILPKMFMDAQTRNVLGLRADGSTRNELTARVYAAATASSFTVYEDDGETPAYQTGAVRETVITQQVQGSTATVTMAAATGTYTGAPSTRSRVVELVANGQSASAVTVNGTALSQATSLAAFGTATSGWVVDPASHVIFAKSAALDVTQSATFVFTLTTP